LLARRSGRMPVPETETRASFGGRPAARYRLDPQLLNRRSMARCRRRRRGGLPDCPNRLRLSGSFPGPGAGFPDLIIGGSGGFDFICRNRGSKNLNIIGGRIGVFTAGNSLFYRPLFAIIKGNATDRDFFSSGVGGSLFAGLWPANAKPGGGRRGRRY